MTTPVSFEQDIKPILQQYAGQMMWRFDLTNYETMKANAEAINYQIQNKMMPPQPWDGQLTDAQIDLIDQWVKGGCAP